ncbi:hypothetical protein D3C75_1230470 [compost metagenome]
MDKAFHPAAPGSFGELFSDVGVGLEKRLAIAPRGRFGGTMPDDVITPHQLFALFHPGTGQIQRGKLCPQCYQLAANGLITPGGMHLMPGVQQPLGGIAP